MLNKKVILATIGVLVLLTVVGGGAFAAGSSYGNAQAQNTRAEFFQARGGLQGAGGTGGQFVPGGAAGQTGQNPQGGQNTRTGAAGRTAAGGTVKSVSGNQIELTAQNGNTITVTVDSQTRIEKTVTGAMGDIQTGARIIVTSDQTGDKLTARTIAIQPQQAAQ